ncbi:hypothetical protein BLNAU_16031 [Blattamonas nauphoetae]|uniref:Uncharacterized protein n=1 Tax=Blattamonas nauphoetae TaxID=2049346 RepID=A0ABQ9XFF2_9EUKA|nr:hypothetical protein BLNAU_16031 [Blattamonas nauphoetae]
MTRRRNYPDVPEMDYPREAPAERAVPQVKKASWQEETIAPAENKVIVFDEVDNFVVALADSEDLTQRVADAPIAKQQALPSLDELDNQLRAVKGQKIDSRGFDISVLLSGIFPERFIEERDEKWDHSTLLTTVSDDLQADTKLQSALNQNAEQGKQKRTSFKKETPMFTQTMGPVEQAKKIVEMTISKWKLSKMFAVTPYQSSDHAHTFIVTFSSPTQEIPIPESVVRLYFTVESKVDSEETRCYFNFEHQQFRHEVDENFILPESWIDKQNENKSKLQNQFTSLATVRSLNVSQKMTVTHLYSVIHAECGRRMMNRRFRDLFDGNVCTYDAPTNSISVYSRTTTNATVFRGILKATSTALDTYRGTCIRCCVYNKLLFVQIPSPPPNNPDLPPQYLTFQVYDILSMKKHRFFRIPLPGHLQRKDIGIVSITMMENTAFVLITIGDMFGTIDGGLCSQTWVLYYHLPSMDESSLVESVEAIQGVDVKGSDVGCFEIPKDAPAGENESESPTPEDGEQKDLIISDLCVYPGPTRQVDEDNLILVFTLNSYSSLESLPEMWPHKLLFFSFSKKQTITIVNLESRQNAGVHLLLHPPPAKDEHLSFEYGKYGSSTSWWDGGEDGRGGVGKGTEAKPPGERQKERQRSEPSSEFHSETVSRRSRKSREEDSVVDDASTVDNEEDEQRGKINFRHRLGVTESSHLFKYPHTVQRFAQSSRPVDPLDPEAAEETNNAEDEEEPEAVVNDIPNCVAVDAQHIVVVYSRVIVVWVLKDGLPSPGIPPYEMTGHQRGTVTQLLLRTPFCVSACSIDENKDTLDEMFLWNLNTHLCVHKLQPRDSLCTHLSSLISLSSPPQFAGSFFLHSSHVPNSQQAASDSLAVDPAKDKDGKATSDDLGFGGKSAQSGAKQRSIMFTSFTKESLRIGNLTTWSVPDFLSEARATQLDTGSSSLSNIAALQSAIRGRRQTTTLRAGQEHPEPTPLDLVPVLERLAISIGMVTKSKKKKKKEGETGQSEEDEGSVDGLVEVLVGLGDGRMMLYEVVEEISHASDKMTPIAEETEEPEADEAKPKFTYLPPLPALPPPIDPRMRLRFTPFSICNGQFLPLDVVNGIPLENDVTFPTIDAFAQHNWMKTPHIIGCHFYDALSFMDNGTFVMTLPPLVNPADGKKVNGVKIQGQWKLYVPQPFSTTALSIQNLSSQRAMETLSTQHLQVVLVGLNRTPLKEVGDEGLSSDKWESVQQRLRKSETETDPNILKTFAEWDSSEDELTQVLKRTGKEKRFFEDEDRREQVKELMVMTVQDGGLQNGWVLSGEVRVEPSMAAALGVESEPEEPLEQSGEVIKVDEIYMMKSFAGPFFGRKG